MTEVRSLLPPEILDIVLDSYQIALRYAFISCAVISILAIISTFYIQRFELATKVRSK
jgi:hypothetical protein